MIVFDMCPAYRPLLFECKCCPASVTGYWIDNSKC